jgi:hypothetical protein
VVLIIAYTIRIIVSHTSCFFPSNLPHEINGGLQLLCYTYNNAGRRPTGFFRFNMSRTQDPLSFSRLFFILSLLKVTPSFYFIYRGLVQK